MNLYVLDEDPTQAAQMLHDRDLVRGVFTCLRILCNRDISIERLALWCCSEQYDGEPAPSTLEWFTHVAHAYCVEYAYRYGRQHKAAALFPAREAPLCLPQDLIQNYPCFIPRGYWESPTAVSREAVVAAHRRYYLLERRRHARYTRRAPPAWLAAALKQPPTLPITAPGHVGHLVGIPVKIESTQVRVSLYDPSQHGMPAVGDAPLVVRYNGTCMSDTYALAPSGVRVLKDIRSYA